MTKLENDSRIGEFDPSNELVYTFWDLGVDDPTAIGNRELLSASQQLLDRVGLSKVEKLNVSSDKPIGLFILPEKKKNDDIEEVESYKQI